MKKTVLLGWELGGGGGHLSRFIPIIELLLEHRWRVVIGLFETPIAHAMLGRFSDQEARDLIVVWLPKIRYLPVSSTANSLTTVLEDMGHTDTTLLRLLVAAWENILRSYSPTIILSDFAPCLNIASFNRVNTCVLGNGWTVPPSDLVSFDPRLDDTEVLRSAKERSQAAITAATNNRVTNIGVADVLRGDERFVCTAVELDPYRAARNDEIYWPLEIKTAIPPLRYHHRERASGLLYLPRGHPATQPALSAVHQSSTAFSAYLGYEIEYRFNGLEVSPQPISLPDFLPTASVLVHHGGLGMACWGLAYSVPQLVCPNDTEKGMIGSALAQLGFGYTFSPYDSVTAIVEILDRTTQLEVPRACTSELQTANGKETLQRLFTLINKS